MLYPPNFQNSALAGHQRFTSSTPVLGKSKWLGQQTGRKYAFPPSTFAQNLVRIPVAGDIIKFDIGDRPHLKRPYDTPHKRTLYIFGRQSEKCDSEFVSVTLADGRQVPASKVSPGERVISLEMVRSEDETYAIQSHEAPRMPETTWKFCTDEVQDTHCVGRKPSYRVSTRLGSVVEVSGATPFLTADGWATAENLVVGDRVASARGYRDCAEFGEGTGFDPDFIRAYAYMIADGGLSGWSMTITRVDPREQQALSDLLRGLGISHKVSKDKTTLIIEDGTSLERQLRADGLRWAYKAQDKGPRGCRSREKVLPRWVFSKATPEETNILLRALWDCDGYVKELRSGIWEIVYATTSKQLASQVKSLLLKFGIPSKIRKNNHVAYRDYDDRDQTHR